MTNSSVTTRPNQTMQNCPRTYCQGIGLVIDQDGLHRLMLQLMVHVSGMQKLILATCISGARLDSNDYKYGWNQATSDGQNSRLL